MSVLRVKDKEGLWQPIKTIKGEKGDVMFATFNIDVENGRLIMTKPKGMKQINFRINENGKLEVLTYGRN